MLNPHDRTSLFDALRPPPGFGFECGTGTSFSLNFEALLTAPIAFTLFDLAAEDGSLGDPGSTVERVVEPVGLLESIRRYAGRLTIFCQAGQIALPRTRRSVFAWFEDAILETSAARPHRLFHPKVWLCRYRSNTDDSSILRVLCATRNLTLDAAMDTILVLESDPYVSRGVATIESQMPLVGLFSGLMRDAGRRLSDDRRSDIQSLVADLERVRLAPPPPFTEVWFHVLGADRQAVFPRSSSRMALVSPFVGEGFLNGLLEDHSIDLLLSRESALDRISGDVLRRCKRIATLHPNAGFDRSDPGSGAPERDESERESQPPGSTLGGLHAKLFVFDVGHRTHVFTGSANATEAAFDGNVEVVAELIGPVAYGVAALLAETPDETGFDDLCIDYEIPVDPPPIDEEAERTAYKLDWFRHSMAASDFRVNVTDSPDGYRLDLSSNEPLDSLPEIEGLRVWPITLFEDQSAVMLAPGEPVRASFVVSLEGMTSFFAIRILATIDDVAVDSVFVINAELEGAPEDRHSRLLAAMLRDPDRLLHYLLLLLSDGSDLTAKLVEDGGDAVFGGWGSGGWGDVPLLELLVKAAARHPERLDHINALLTDLGEHRTATVPNGFDPLWTAVWEHRERTRS